MKLVNGRADAGVAGDETWGAAVKLPAACVQPPFWEQRRGGGPVTEEMRSRQRQDDRLKKLEKMTRLQFELAELRSNAFSKTQQGLKAIRHYVRDVEKLRAELGVTRRVPVLDFAWMGDDGE
jgi:hypothetical protein